MPRHSATPNWRSTLRGSTAATRPMIVNLPGNHRFFSARFLANHTVFEANPSLPSWISSKSFFGNFSLENNGDRGSLRHFLQEAKRPVRLAVRTPPFHGGNTGSIPVRVATLVSTPSIMLGEQPLTCSLSRDLRKIGVLSLGVVPKWPSLESGLCRNDIPPRTPS